MGEDVDAQGFSRADRTKHREKVKRCLDVFAQMLSRAHFDTDDPMTGMEVEFNLVDDEGWPSLNNEEALAAIDHPAFQTELGRFNVEINCDPKRLRENGLSAFEADLRRSLNAAETKCSEVGAHLLMIGILPTLTEEHFGADALSSDSRYRLLSDQILDARGEDIEIVIHGPETLRTVSDTIMPEAACTSTQFHVQTSPDEFASHWNASQAMAAVQVALGANSPYLLGKELWHETRIPLFEQSTDTRSDELKSQGVRPRVWFGERWINSVFDLFEENVRYFPALLPVVDDEDPEQVLEAGGTPQLRELRLHNGTVYRWNRPIYDIADSVPHLRVENRVLGAGPTVVDTIANAAFYFGLVRSLARQDRPLWSRMSFGAADENLHVAARDGIGAEIYWPGVGQVQASELALRRLLPLADQGLQDWGVEAAERDRYLGIIEGRCRTRRNGAEWFIRRVSERRGASEGEAARAEALRATVVEYAERMHTNEPVHTWD